jgi:hypothetical protein
MSNSNHPRYPTNGTMMGAQMSCVPGNNYLKASAARSTPTYQRPNNANLYQNIVDQNADQAAQLDRSVLMPANWRYPTAAAAAGGQDGSDFAKHTVTPQGYNTYLATSGSARFSLQTRDPVGRQGMRNLLRTPAPVNVGSIDDIAWGVSETWSGRAQGYGCPN